jgi:ribokinase
VDSSLLAAVKGDETDFGTILIGPDGGRTILIYRGGTRIESDLIAWDELSAGWFYVASIEGNLDLLEKLANFAHKRGIKIAANPGRKELGQKDKLKPVLNKVDVVILNREEAARLTGLSIADEKIYPAMAEMIKEMAVITDGRRGATLYTRKEEMLTSDGFEVKMADSTGAGDGFGCGFIAGLIMNWGLEEALKLGVCNGASAVTKIGAKTGLLKKEEIKEWMKKPLRMEWRKK